MESSTQSGGQTGMATGTVVGIGGVVAVAAVGAFAWWMNQAPPEQTSPEVAASLMTPEPVAVPEPQPLSILPPPMPPAFDLVRIEADGAAQVAGRAAPGTTVVLRIDGADVAETTAGGDGTFLAQFTLAPNAAASLLSLATVMPDGAVIPGTETVAVAPIVGPVVTAARVEAPVDGTVAAPATETVAVAEPVAEPPAALLVTDAGVELLQAAEGAIAGSVTIDTISYTADGSVQFGGRGVAAQVVRLYLDNAVLAEVSVPAGGQWGLTKSDIAPGIYTLRADQVDRAGKVTSRFETPFKRETLPALAEVAAPVEVPVVAKPDVAATSPEVVADAGPAVVANPEPMEAPQPSGLPVISLPTQSPVLEGTAAPPTAAAPDTTGIAPAAPVADADQPVAETVLAVTSPSIDPAPGATPSPVSITVQPGLTLWAIAEANFGEGIRYVQVYEANKDKIRDPDLIYPGQVFTVPAEP